MPNTHPISSSPRRMARRYLLGIGVLAAAAIGGSQAFVLPPLPTSRLPSPIAPTPTTKALKASYGAAALPGAGYRPQQQQQRRWVLQATASAGTEEGGRREGSGLGLRRRLVGKLLGAQRRPTAEPQQTQKRRAAVAAAAVVAKYALPALLCAAVVWAAAPAVVSAAAGAGADGGRVNKVKEYVLKPLGRALSPLTNAAAGVKEGPLGQFLQQGWTEPSTRYMLAPPISPDDIPGRVLEAIQSRLPPTWSPTAVVALLAFLPIFEARVAVPFGLALGAPWLRALTVGLAANALAIPVAAALGQVFRDLNDAEPLQEVAAAAREQYQARERGYQEAVGRLAAKRTQLQEEELRLGTTIDKAIAAVRQGDILMDMATRQGLVADITEASRVLLELDGPDLVQFRQRLDDQFFRTSVGSVMPESDGAFEEVTVAQLGQRRVEVAWHPDVTLFPMVGQAAVAYQMEEIVAQSAYDFGVRPRELEMLRRDVAALEQEAAAAARLRDAARQAAAGARETVSVARAVEQRIVTAEDAAAARRAKMQEKLAAKKAQAQPAAGGPPAFVPAEEREKEEEKRVAELQMKGKMMMNYGWPKAIVYVGLPLPFSGAWTAMFWSAAFGMKFGPSALASLLGVGLSTLVGLALWLTGPIGVVIYGLVLALLYGQENPVTFVGSLLKSVKDGLFGGSEGKKK